jgi:cytochrome c1
MRSRFECVPIFLFPRRVRNLAHWFNAGVRRGDYLKLYIRNPQSLRQWPQAKMPAITQQVLPDEGLDQVIAYLRHMAGRKASQ